MMAGRGIVGGGRRIVRSSVTMQVPRVTGLLVMIPGPRVIAGLIFGFRWRGRRGLLIHILVLYNDLRRLTVLILVLIDDLLIVVITKVVLVLIVLKQKGVLVEVYNCRVI